MLSGARAGTRRALTADFATIGRHPSAELQLDPEQDTEVSARHAAVFRQGPGYVVRDLGSPNGTWLNGGRIRSDRLLEHGDKIRLGAQGPEIEFLMEQALERPPARLVEPDEPRVSGPLTPSRRTAVIEQEQSMTELKLRVEAARQTDRLRQRLFLAAAAVTLAILGLLMWLAWSARENRRALEREQARLLASVDSVHALLGAAAERSPGLRSALERARGETEQLRGRVSREATSREAIESLEPEMRQQLTAHAPLLSAALFDPTAIITANGRAIAMVFAQTTAGARTRSTGFVLRVSADTGWLVANRAALLDSTGAPVERIAVAFNGGTQAWRARVIAEQQRTGLALIRVHAWGHVFPVAAIRDSTAAPGQPVIVFGFPPDTTAGSMSWQRDGLRASIMTATLTDSEANRLQVDGYGAPAWRGSPVFNAAGELIGVMQGDAGDARTLSAIPVSAIRGWMRP